MSKRYLLLMLMGADMVLPCRFADQKQQELPTPPNQKTLINDNVKQLLLLMDTDWNGKISRDEWMKFMAAEFDRLDKDKSVSLSQIAIPSKRFSAVGK